MILITRTKFLTVAGLLALLGIMLCPAGRADDLSVTLVTPIAGTAGQTIVVYGDITNNTASTLYFGGENLVFNDLTTLSGGPDVIINALFFGGPASVSSSTPLTDVDIFTLTINPSAAPGVYDLNYYQLTGGTDPNCINDDCSGSSGTLDFSVTVLGPAITPEPGSLALLASGLLVGFLTLRRAGQ